MTDSPGSGHKGATGLALPAQEGRTGMAAAEPATGGAALRFEEVFRTCFDYVWRSLRRLGVPDASVDDAVQDVFLVVHRRAADFEGRSSLKTWLYGIVLRVAHDYRRSKIRHGGDPVPLDESMRDGGPGPHEAAVRCEALRVLQELLSQMDEEKRDVLVLSDAEVLGVPINTVYSRLRAARRQLNEALERREREKR